MRDAGPVSAIQRVANLHRNRQRVADWKHRRFLQSRCERLALEMFEDDVVLVAVTANVVNRADVRIVERCDGARFLLEALTRLGIRRERTGQHLDRDSAIEPRIASSIHFAHAPFTERGHDFVRTKTGPSVERHRVRAF